MKIAIIGGGPVGLMAAILASQRFGYAADITVFEKRNDYTRMQIFVIQPDVINIIPYEIRKDIWEDGSGCYVNPPRFDGDASCYEKSSKNKLETTTFSQFEKSAKKYALSSNIKFSQKHLTSLPDNFDIIMAADGSNSIAHNILETEQINKLKSYGLGVIFKSKPEITKSKYQKKINPEGHQDRYRGFRTKKEDSYLGIQIGKKDFELLSKTKITFLKDSTVEIQSIVKSGVQYYNFDTNMDDAKIFTFPISIGYTLPAKTKTFDGTPIYLIGDSLIRSHFFSGSGLNIGILSARCAVNNIFDYYGHHTPYGYDGLYGYLDNKYDDYHKCIMSLIKRAINDSEKVSKNFDKKSLTEACNAHNISMLKKISSKRGIKPKKLNKQELCYLLSNSIDNNNVTDNMKIPFISDLQTYHYELDNDYHQLKKIYLDLASNNYPLTKNFIYDTYHPDNIASNLRKYMTKSYKLFNIIHKIYFSLMIMHKINDSSILTKLIKNKYNTDETFSWNHY